MTTITESQWVNYFGFQRFPFDRPEAGNEEFGRPDFLASCFVEPRGFERFFGQADAPVSSLLFAARGTGKTACRVMMDYYCQNGFAESRLPNSGELSYVLSIPHIRLDNVLAIARQNSPNTNPPEMLVEHHVVEIMRQAVTAFVKLISKNSDFIDNVKNLPKADFEDLSLFIIVYSTYLTSPQKDFLRAMGVEMPPLDSQTIGFLGLSSPHDRPSSWETSLFKQRLAASPLNHLERWVELIYRIGIKATYVLIDGVDELMNSAQDPKYAYYLIRPLLTHLRLMDETHHLALKFFLPSSMEQIILSDPAFRRDRGFVVQSIEWEEDDLIDILRRRLGALSQVDDRIRDQTIMGFDALCVPELRWAIEYDLARNANGNPRYLMNLCAQMVMAHCSREIENQDDPYQLNRDDFNYAIDRVKSLYRRIVINPDFRKGEILQDRYRVEKVINTKHSQIIKAWDESLTRFVAIKSPRIDQSRLDENAVDKVYKNLRREAGILAKLQHPNIGQVFDILEEPFGVVMEWVDGYSIQDLSDKKERLPVKSIVSVGTDIADALAYAHGEGVIHRDIKPKNIILTTNNRAKLIDFGIARDEFLDTVTSSEDGSRFLVGTPRYSSPEQLARPDEISMSEIGPASDIFSLGVVLYEMLTLKKPYAYGNRLGQYDKNVFPYPEPHGIPDSIYQILLKMLDGKISKRLTAIELKSELEKLQQIMKY